MGFRETRGNTVNFVMETKQKVIVEQIREYEILGNKGTK